MLAALFIQGGINALRDPEAHAQAAKPVLDAVAPAVDKAAGRRPDDVLMIKIDGVVKVAAGTMLAFGKFPRLASTALAASLVPTTLAAHRFWEESDPQAKQEQQIHFLKNVSMLGGLLLAAADTEGRPSLAWQGRKAAKRAAAVTATQTGALTGAAHDITGRVTGAAHDVGGKVSGTARSAGGSAAGLAAGLAGLAPAAGGVISARAPRKGPDVSSRVGELSTELSRRAARARRKAKKRRAKLQKRAAKRGARLQKATAKRLERAGALREQASKLGHDLAVRATAVGSEVVHQAEGLAKDARKRAH